MPDEPIVDENEQRWCLAAQTMFYVLPDNPGMLWVDWRYTLVPLSEIMQAQMPTTVMHTVTDSLLVSVSHIYDHQLERIGLYSKGLHGIVHDLMGYALEAHQKGELYERGDEQ